MRTHKVLEIWSGPHFDGRRYFNPSGANGQPFWKVPGMLLSRRTPWPAQLPVHRWERPSPHGPDDWIVTFIGHSTFLIQTEDTCLVTDPIYSQRASPTPFAGPRRVRRPGIPFDELPRIKVVLVSHNHYDHCDLSTLWELDRRDKPTFITPLGNGSLLRSAGVRNIEELDWWDEIWSGAIGVTSTPAQHFSARNAFDRNCALWSSFVISGARRRIFFAGDSGYATHFRAIRERCGPMDLALLPIGAYEPRWFMKDIHMNPAESVQAHLDLEAKRSIGMHFSTFQLTPEGIDEPVKSLNEALGTREIQNPKFTTLDVGQSIQFA